MSFKPYRNQIFSHLKSYHLQTGTLFEDPEFPACQESLYLYKPLRNLKDSSKVKWKRPFELCKNPELIVGDINRKDLHQGKYLGNCWFVAGTVAVATIQEHFKIIMPNDQSFRPYDYCGIFHFRFWVYGEWYDVVVDDRLPVLNNPFTFADQLLFCSNRKCPNEFWCSLLEKAYAKLAICYEFLDAGFTQDAIVDLTGGITENLYIDRLIQKGMIEDIWNYMYKAYQMKSLCGANIHKNRFGSGNSMEQKLPNGLILHHAYSVTKVVEIIENTVEHKYYNSIYYPSRSNLDEHVSRGLNPLKKFFNKFDNNYPHMDNSLNPIYATGQNNRIRLIRVNNPWSDEHEWRGAYSDNSPEWHKFSSQVKAELGLVKEKDGEFWMSFEDFISNFDTLEFVHVNLHAFFDENRDNQVTRNLTWKCKKYDGKWVDGNRYTPEFSAGGNGHSDSNAFWCNPQYAITLPLLSDYYHHNKTTLIVSLIHKDINELRYKNGGQLREFPKKFRLFRVKKRFERNDGDLRSNLKFSASQLEHIGSSDEYTMLREVSKRFYLEPGQYVIIPCTREKHQTGNFLLRLFTEAPLNDENFVNLSFNNPEDNNYDAPDQFDDVEDALRDQLNEGIFQNYNDIMERYNTC